MPTASSSATASSTAFSSGPITLPLLPWAENALEPVISAKTISFHYGKHHKTYVDTVNKMIAGTEFADMTLEKTRRRDGGQERTRREFFNNAAHRLGTIRSRLEQSARQGRR